MNEVVCNKCGFTVKQNPRFLEGCGCDPDSPSWIAIEPDGRMLKMSAANYTVIAE